MKHKRWTARIAALCLTGLVFAGVWAMASSYGTQDDPLVSLSYIEQVLKPELSQQTQGQVDQKAAEVDSKISQYTSQIDRKLAEYQSEASGAATSAFQDKVVSGAADRLSGQQSGSAAFVQVTVPAGKTLIAQAGTQLLLYSGSAACTASASPGLIDTTTGGDLANGKVMERNHLYVSPADGRGVKASAATVLLVSGAYSIQ